MALPVKNVAFSFMLGLVDTANRPQFKAAPTLAAGDFKHSGDGSALANLGTLPAADPAAGRLIKVSLSQAEMNYDRVTVQCVDAAGSEWDEVIVTINTIDNTVASIGANVVQVSGDSTAADNAEAFFDGTGYAGTNNVIPLVTLAATVTTLTNLPAITAGWLTAAGIAADAITAAKIADGAIDTATFASGTTIPRCTLTDTVTTYTGNTPQTGDGYAIVNSGVHGNAAIKGYVDDIGVAGAGLSAVPWNAAWDAEVQSEVEDGLNALGFTATVSGRIDAAVSSRASQASVDTIDDLLDTEVAAIKAKTDQLTFTTANQVDARTRTLDDGLIDDDTLAVDLDTYQAKVWLFDDDSGTTDRYVVQWFKNGAPVTSGVTSPVIQVFKASDGSDLIASKALTQIASTGAYRYNATAAERIASGSAYVAHTAATIDGASRTWRQPVGRDSA